MTYQRDRFWTGRALFAALFGIYVSDLTFLRAEVLAQAATGMTIEMGQAKGLSAEEIRDRGNKLRADLDKAFNTLQESEKAGHADELTAIVHPYISAGMALEDAVGILSAAGFSAPPRAGGGEQQDRDGGKDRYAVVAEIPQFSGRVFGNVEVFVMLLRPGQGLAEYIGRRHRMMYVPRR